MLTGIFGGGRSSNLDDLSGFIGRAFFGKVIKKGQSHLLTLPLFLTPIFALVLTVITV
jgi:hypothetical protein